jgi:hypothetical protein
MTLDTGTRLGSYQILAKLGVADARADLDEACSST